AAPRRHREHPDHRLGSDRHRSGCRVRLLGDAGLPGAARRGLSRNPRQLQPRHDHDRPGGRRRYLRRALDGRDSSRDHPPRASRRAPPYPRWPDCPEPRDRAARKGHPRRVRRRAPRRVGLFHPQGGGPAPLPRGDGAHRPQGSRESRRQPRRRSPGTRPK
ncbi:Carbamoyl-phosphate synthase large chain, partial [uncultured Rubrobacteraceae bacterium]